MPEAMIASVARSPIGRAYKGSLIGERGDELLLQMAQAALGAVPEFDPADLDEVLVGCALDSGELGGNIGRLIPVLLGLDGVPGFTLNRYCASSLQTTRSAVHAIRVGDGHAYLSLGVESVSRVGDRGPDPHPDERNPRFPVFTAAEPWTDPRERGEMPDAFISMGETAENVANSRGITREQMDQYAFESQQRAAQAAADGFWARDIVPVTRADGSVVSTDDSPRPGTTLEGLAALTPSFRPDGSITAGNACPLNDGAAAVLILSEERAGQLGVTPRARVVSTAVSALSPEIMGLGTIEAARRALAAASLTADDIDLFEINEAFAAQVIPTYRELGIPREKVNIMGGALAVGHPFGMSGARITSTLLNALEWTGGRYGLQTMCVAGGQGMAMVIERLS